MILIYQLYSQPLPKSKINSTNVESKTVGNKKEEKVT